MKLGENIEHGMGHLSVLEFWGNLFTVMSIEFLKLTLVLDLSPKNIMVWMKKVVIVIQVKKMQKLFKHDDNNKNAVHK